MPSMIDARLHTVGLTACLVGAMWGFAAPAHAQLPRRDPATSESAAHLVATALDPDLGQVMRDRLTAMLGVGYVNGQPSKIPERLRAQRTALARLTAQPHELVAPNPLPSCPMPVRVLADSDIAPMPVARMHEAPSREELSREAPNRETRPDSLASGYSRALVGCVNNLNR